MSKIIKKIKDVRERTLQILICLIFLLKRIDVEARLNRTLCREPGVHA